MVQYLSRLKYKPSRTEAIIGTIGARQKTISVVNNTWPT